MADLEPDHKGSGLQLNHLVVKDHTVSDLPQLLDLYPYL